LKSWALGEFLRLFQKKLQPSCDFVSYFPLIRVEKTSLKSEKRPKNTKENKNESYYHKLRLQVCATERNQTLMGEDSQNLLVEPILVGSEDAASMLNISLTAFKALDRAGQIGPMPVRIGMLKRKLWSVSELRQWAEAKCPRREIWQGIENNFKKN
jgi:hypothetical protein